MTFLTILAITEILCSFRLVLEGKKGKEIPESSRLEFLGKFLANSFALSDAKINTSGPLLNREGIADLPLLRILSREPNFGEMTGSFILSAYASFKNPFATITSLSELYIQRIYSVGTNEKSDFYELWHRHKQLKTMEISEA